MSLLPIEDDNLFCCVVKGWVSKLRALGIERWGGSIKPLKLLVITSLVPKLHYSRSPIFRALKTFKTNIDQRVLEKQQFEACGIV